MLSARRWGEENNSFPSLFLHIATKWSRKWNPDWVWFSSKLAFAVTWPINSCCQTYVCLVLKSLTPQTQKSKYLSLAEQTTVEVDLPVSLTSHFLYPDRHRRCGQDLRYPQHLVRTASTRWSQKAQPLFVVWPPRNESKEEGNPVLRTSSEMVKDNHCPFWTFLSSAKMVHYISPLPNTEARNVLEPLELAIDECELPCLCWELKLSSLEGQPVLLTSISAAPDFCIYTRKWNCSIIFSDYLHQI